MPHGPANVASVGQQMLGAALDGFGKRAAARGDLDAADFCSSRERCRRLSEGLKFAIQIKRARTQPAGDFDATLRGQAAVERHGGQTAALQREKKREPFRAVGQAKSDPLAGLVAPEMLREIEAGFGERVRRPGNIPGGVDQHGLVAQPPQPLLPVSPEQSCRRVFHFVVRIPSGLLAAKGRRENKDVEKQGIG